MATILMDAYRYVPPVASDFGTILGTNSVSPTLTDTTGRGLVMDFGLSPAATHNMRLAVKAKTAGANQDIILRQQPSIFTGYARGAGLILRESGSGKLIAFGNHSNGIQAHRWTSQAVFSATIGTVQFAASGCNYDWFKITLVSDDPKQFFVSRNGTDWTQLIDATQTAFMTFDQVGLYTYSDGAAQPVAGTSNLTNSILYYKDAGIVPSV